MGFVFSFWNSARSARRPIRLAAQKGGDAELAHVLRDILARLTFPRIAIHDRGPARRPCLQHVGEQFVPRVLIQRQRAGGDVDRVAFAFLDRLDRRADSRIALEATFTPRIGWPGSAASVIDFALFASPFSQTTSPGASFIGSAIATASVRIVGDGSFWIFTEIVFVCIPRRCPRSKRARDSPFSPGAYVFLSSAAVVQPHEDFTSPMVTVAGPSFTNGNFASIILSFGPGARSARTRSHLIAARAASGAKRSGKRTGQAFISSAASKCARVGIAPLKASFGYGLRISLAPIFTTHDLSPRTF